MNISGMVIFLLDSVGSIVVKYKAGRNRATFFKNIKIEFRILTRVEGSYECLVFASSTSDKRIRLLMCSYTLCTKNPSGRFPSRNNSKGILK